MEHRSPGEVFHFGKHDVGHLVQNGRGVVVYGTQVFSLAVGVGGVHVLDVVVAKVRRLALRVLVVPMRAMAAPLSTGAIRSTSIWYQLLCVSFEARTL